MRKNLVVLAVLLTAGLIAFTGCGGGNKEAEKAGPGGEKTVTLFTMQLKPTFTQYMEGLIAGFEKANPGVKVKWLDYPAQEYETKLLSLILQKDGAPDVINLPYETMLHFREKNLLLKLDDVVSSEAQSKYVDSVLEEGGKIDGQLYALPWYLASGVMMYNKDLVKRAGLDPEKPPLNTQEFFAMSRQVKERTGAFGQMVCLTEEGALKQLLAGEGIPLTRPSKDKPGKLEAAFNTPEAVKLLQDYKKMYDDGVIPRESMTGEHRRVIDLYQSGKTAFMLSGPQFLVIVKKEAPNIYGVTGVGPAIPIGKTGKYGVDVQNLCIYGKTPYPKEAADLALWITNGPNQLTFAKQVTIFPSVKEALADEYFTKPGTTPEDKARNIAAAQISSATVYLKPLPRLSELNKASNDTMQKIMLQNVPVEQALTECEKKWNEILAK